MALFESYERRIDKINEVLNSYGIASLEEAEKITKDAGLDVYNQIKGIQPICFENACWAYITGAAIAIKQWRADKRCRVDPYDRPLDRARRGRATGRPLEPVVALTGDEQAAVGRPAQVVGIEADGNFVALVAVPLRREARDRSHPP